MEQKPREHPELGVEMNHIDVDLLTGIFEIWIMERGYGCMWDCVNQVLMISDTDTLNVELLLEWLAVQCRRRALTSTTVLEPVSTPCTTASSSS